MLMRSSGPVTQYQYPIPNRLERALEDTSKGFLRDVKACIEWTNETPSSPYSEEMIERFTGTKFGMEVVSPGTPYAKIGQPARNDSCFCGSGKKYKRCHGSSAGDA